MSLAHIILGLLQQQPQTGYDLKTSSFDRCIAHLWSADQAQIYRTLDKLVAQGWITCSVEIQHDRPNRKVYSVTAAGASELNRWLQSDQPLPKIREPLIAQLFFAAQLPNAAMVQLLEHQLAAHSEKLVECQAIELQLPMLGDSSATREQILQRLILELVLQREQTYIDWLKQAIDLINNQKMHETT